MKWIVSLLSILILILLQSCSQNQSSSETHSTEAAKVLDINNIKINNTEPALSVSEVIKLETVGNKALINQISKIIRYDKQLYILTQVPQNGVFIFSDNGVFNCKIPKGRANNELLYPMDIALDESTGNLLVLDLYRSVKVFSATGKYKKLINLDIPLFHLEHMRNDDLVFYSSNIAKNTHNFYCYDQDRKLKGLYKNLYKGKPYLFSDILTKLNPDSLFVHSVFSDTIYLYRPEYKSLQPFFIMDYGGKGVNENISELNDVGSHLQYAQKNNRYIGLQIAYYHNKKLFFSFSRGKADYWAVFSEADNRLTAYEKLFDELPNHYGLTGHAAEHVIYAYDIPWLKKHFEKHPPGTEQGKRIEAMCANEDDNPIIVFAKFS